MRKKGNSYKEISVLLNVSKATVYKYSSSIKLSKKAKKTILSKIRLNQQKFVKKYAVLKNLKKNVKWSINKIRIISHCLFDGSLTKYTLNYTNTSKMLIIQFINDVYSVYGINPTLLEKKPGSFSIKYTVYFCCKRLCDDLRKYSPSYSTVDKISQIPEKVFYSNKEEIRNFLRAFWEDEGCITIKGEILGRIRSRKIRNQLLILHLKVGVECSSYDSSDDMYGLRIYKNEENIKRFNKIGFGNAVIIRGFNKGVKKQELFERLCLKKV